MSLLRKMWFGTKEFSRWIKVQSPDSTPGMAGSSERLDFGNGGVAIRDSVNGHMEYAMTWNRLTQREAREITDFAYGLYGSDLLYLSEPSATGQNALNKTWSAPGLTAKDGIPLAGDTRPEIVKNYDQSQDYPVDMAKYQITGATARRSFYVPIPPGHTAWVGAHGDAASTGGVSVQPTNRGVASGAPTALGILGVNTPQRFNGSFPAAGDQAGLELSLEAASAITNLSLVPSFEAGTTPIVLRTNGCINPKPATGAITGWSSSGGAVTVGANGFTTTNTTSTTPYIFSAAYEGDIAVGDIMAIRCKVRATPVEGQAGPTLMTVRPHKNTGNVYYQADEGLISIPVDGNTYDLSFHWTSLYVIPNAENFNVTAVGNGAAPVGFSLSMDEVLIEKVAAKRPDLTVGPCFWGGFSPDVDMTGVWTGTVRASPSNLTGVPVVGMTVVRGFAIRSTQWVKEGSYSMRLIPSAAASASPVAAVTPGVTTLNASGVVTSYTTAPLTGSSILAGSLRRASPIIVDVRPNVPGEYTHRIQGAVTAATSFELWGSTFGGGDIWFDMLGIVAGAYSGPAFTGRSPGASWTGAADLSTSTLTNRTATLAGIMVQVLPTGETPADGPYISGQGAGGLEFEGRVQAVPYSLAHDSFGLAVKLVETEEWK